MVKGRRVAGATKREGNASTRGSLLAGALVVGLGMQFASAASIEREGMRYEDSLKLGASKLVLNGLGVRGAGFLKGYVAGLYLPGKATEADQVYDAKGAKRIAVRMLVAVNGDTLAKTFGDGIRKNYKDDALEALRERMDVFDGQVRAVGSVKRGDAIDLDYEPATGTHLRVNGKEQGGAIAGDDFYVALLKMFIGERAVDKGLRAALLGTPNAQ